jgi:hypothetical protein
MPVLAVDPFDPAHAGDGLPGVSIVPVEGRDSRMRGWVVRVMMATDGEWS